MVVGRVQCAYFREISNCWKFYHTDFPIRNSWIECIRMPKYLYRIPYTVLMGSTHSFALILNDSFQCDFAISKQNLSDIVNWRVSNEHLMQNEHKVLHLLTIRILKTDVNTIDSLLHNIIFHLHIIRLLMMCELCTGTGQPLSNLPRMKILESILWKFYTNITLYRVRFVVFEIPFRCLCVCVVYFVLCKFSEPLIVIDVVNVVALIMAQLP